jgi:2-oxo-3-hexenedioate decarboxylase
MATDARAAAILAAFSDAELITPFTEADPAFGLHDAYRLADEVHAMRVLRGERPVGRKIGFTNRDLWIEHKAPVWGHVYDSTLREPSHGVAHVSIDGLLQPRIEPEIQLHFASTPPVTSDESELLDAIDWIALGFEIVQSPYPDWRFGTADAIAACTLHGLLIVGRPVPVSDIDDCAAKLASFTVTLTRDGRGEATGGGADVLDSPLLAFVHLARVLAEQPGARPVEAGEIVTTGTLTPALPIVPGESWSTEIEGIDLPATSVVLA